MWHQRWTNTARLSRNRLPLSEVSTLCRAVELYANGTGWSPVVRTAPNEAALIVGKWRVHVQFEHNANVVDDDGETVLPDVIWVMAIFVPAPLGITP